MKFWGKKDQSKCSICKRDWDIHTQDELAYCIRQLSDEELLSVRKYKYDELNMLREKARWENLAEDQWMQRRVPTLPKETVDVETDDSVLDDFAPQSDSWTDKDKEDSEKSENESEPLQILKIRFAKGEITKEEFIEMKRMLE